MSFGKVAVLMGGTSAERAISLQSGNSVLQALLKVGINAETIDTAEPFIEKLIKGNFSRVFIALHGKGGEDGTINGLLDYLGIPYTGSGVLGSALAMNKIKTKQIWQQMGIPTPRFKEINNPNEAIQFAKQWGYPIAIKPALEGSSLGVSKVTNEQDIKKAFATAVKYGKPTMVESWITGKNYMVSMLNGRLLPPLLVEPKEEFLSYDAKYNSKNTNFTCQCLLSAKQEEQLKNIAKSAFQAIGITGWGRIDTLCDQNNNFFGLEINTVPGLTATSQFFYSYKQTGKSFSDLIVEILSQTLLVQTRDLTTEIAYKAIS